MNTLCRKHKILMEKISIKRFPDGDRYYFKCHLCGPDHGVIVIA